LAIAVQIDRYKVKPLPTAPRRILRVNLKTKVATLRQNAQLKLLEPPTTASNSMSWNLNKKL